VTVRSPEGLKRLLREFRIPEDSEIARKMSGYLALLDKWNRRINLTAGTEWPAVETLFREAIWISEFYPANALRHLDIGSGAGFPAILLRVLVPRIRLEMVESRGKKGAFLETAVHALDLEGARVHSMRLDEFLRQSEDTESWDCITWKGLKLSRSDLLRLRGRTHPEAQFWMLHGRAAAAEDRGILESHFALARKEQFPRKKEWFLSIYTPKK